MRFLVSSKKFQNRPESASCSDSPDAGCAINFILLPPAGGSRAPLVAPRQPAGVLRKQRVDYGRPLDRCDSRWAGGGFPLCSLLAGRGRAAPPRPPARGSRGLRNPSQARSGLGTRGRGVLGRKLWGSRRRHPRLSGLRGSPTPTASCRGGCRRGPRRSPGSSRSKGKNKSAGGRQGAGASWRITDKGIWEKIEARNPGSSPGGGALSPEPPVASSQSSRTLGYEIPQVCFAFNSCTSKPALASAARQDRGYPSGSPLSAPCRGVRAL